MKSIKFAATALVIAIVFAAVAVVAKVEPAKAYVGNDLGDLIVTNGLFTGYNAQDLAGLIAVDSTTSGGMGGYNDLGDLILLTGLFGFNDAEDLAGLIAVDNIYN